MAWAAERLTQSHDYWFATVHPASRPHMMPVWGVFLDGQLWCSTSPASRKSINLRANPAVSVTTDNPSEPVVVEGVAAIVVDAEAIAQFAAAMDTKYDTTYGSAFYSANLTVRVALRRVFGIDTGLSGAAVGVRSPQEECRGGSETRR